MIIRMMYVLPMILGRTYDLRTHSVGVDLFSQKDIEKPRMLAWGMFCAFPILQMINEYSTSTMAFILAVIEEAFYNSNFKTIETSADVKEVLDINGDLSLNIKAGTFTIGGFGAYVKSSAQTQNSVDILIKVRFRTISESLPFYIKPVPMWKTMGKTNLGTHYVQSILYGGDLIACIRFKAHNSEDLQEIRATITSSVSAGSALDLVGEGKLESLDRQLKRKATMEINYFATVPLEGVPNNIEGLRDLVKNFKDHVAKVNNGTGVPVEVELVEISNFDREFEYLKNLDLETELEIFEIYLDDLLSTKNRIQTILFEHRDTLTNEEVKEIADISGRVSKILRAFISTIANMDTEKNSQQLDSAMEAYREGTRRQMPGKFKRLLNKIAKKIAAKKSDEQKQFSTYTQYGSGNCAENKITNPIYSGYVASSPKNHIGSGVNLLCLPKNPVDMSSEPTMQRNGSILAGVKYGELKTRPFKFFDNNIVFNGVVCSVCLVNAQTVYTFYGQQDCPESGGWKMQYAGYAMISETMKYETVCVDSKLEAHQDSYAGLHDQNLKFVLSKHPDKKNVNVFLPCAVCSK